MLNNSVGVDLVQHSISVALLTSSKDYYFVHLAHFFEETEGKGSNRHVALQSFLDLNLYLTKFLVFSLAVNQGLIHVDDQHFFVSVFVSAREVQGSIGLRDIEVEV